jgi:hypothetical protein
MWFFFIAVALFVLYKLFYKKKGGIGSKNLTRTIQPRTYEKKTTSTRPLRNSTQGLINAAPPTNKFISTYVRTFIAGIPHRLGKNIQINSLLTIGQTLDSQREPMNQYDSNAVKLLVNGKHIGYIPKDDNPKIARHMDAGKTISVTVTAIDATDLWRGVQIRVILN